MHLFQKWIAAISLGLVAFGAGASPSNPQNGTEYLTLSKPMATDAGKKIEVIEFFSYACPHCNALDPALSDWVKKQGDKIVFKRVPVAFGRPAWTALQKLYFSLDSLGKLEELHPQVFNAIHKERIQLDSDDIVADFVAKRGVDKAKFLSIYNSFGVQTKVSRALQIADAYKVDSIPMLVIDGRYVTSPSMAGATLGSQQESVLHVAMLQIMDVLLKKVAPAAAPAEAAPPASAPAAKSSAPAKASKK